MPKVRATATMYTDLEWIGEIPDDVPEDDWFDWIKTNVDGGYYDEIGGDWTLHDVEAEDE